MDKDLKIALIRNLILKTKVVILFFIFVFVLQLSVLFYLKNIDAINHVSLVQLFLIPLFIAGLVLSEYFVLKYLNKTLREETEFSNRSKYIITFLEVLYPSILMLFGSVLIRDNNIALSSFMFLNAAPFVVYFIFIMLSALYLDFKISFLTGLNGAIGYIVINLLLFNTDSTTLYVNLSKTPFIVVTGILAGIVGKKLKDSIVSSLESKNILIHELDSKVKIRTEKIERQKSKLTEQFNLLEEHSREIGDSIKYAERIQRAILPADDFVDKHLPNSFIYYQPKDVVAGDFYWMKHRNGDLIFAAADCTGHGVPGAMVSVVCNNALNRAIDEFRCSDTGQILDKTREIIVQEFSNDSFKVSDGMDIALCKLKNVFKEFTDSNESSKKMVLEYSGANNPIWIIRNGQTEVEEIKADKQPIGIFDSAKPFSTHQIELNAGDTFYIFSDGYADQFGGERGKKFKTANLKKLLLSIQSIGIQEQKTVLEESLTNWMGEIQQVDDVCIIGVRI